MPAKIAFAGEKTYEIYIRGRFQTFISSGVLLVDGTYQTDAPRNGSRKCAQDVYSWAQPFCQSLVGAARFVKFLNLILKHSKDGTSRVTCLQLGGKRVCDKVFPGLPLIGFHSTIENDFEAR